MALLLTLLVTVAGVESFTLLAESSDHYDAANAGADLNTDMGELLGASWDLVRPGADVEGASTAAIRYGAKVRRDAEALRGAGFEPDVARPLAASAMAFARSVDSERVLSLLHRSDEAQLVAARHDAMFKVLTARTSWLTAELRREAGRDAGALRLEIVALTGLVVAIVAGLLSWDGRRRRRIAHADTVSQQLTRFEAIVEHSSDVMVLTDREGRVTYVTPSILRVIGRAPPASGDLLGGNGAVHPDDLDALGALSARALREGGAGPVDIRVHHADGHWVTMEVTVADLTAVPEVGGLLWTGRDVTAQAVARAALLESEAGFRLLFERNPHPMWVFDRQSLGFLEVNTAAVDQYGWSRDEFLAMTIVDIRLPEDVERLHEWLRTAGEGLRHGGLQRHRTKGGDAIDVDMSSHTLEFGGQSAVLATAQNVTQRLEAERALVHRTMHDSLTGLANRSVLVDRLEQALTRCERPGEQVAVIFLNLDRFKVINDGKGRGVGDRLLIEVGARLRGAVRPGNTVARFGGDEFVVLLQGVADEAELRAVNDRIAWALDAPFLIDGTDLFVSASQGIAVGAPGESADVVLSRADAGMCRAKDRGGARAEFADEAVRTSSSNRLDLESSLRRAIDNEEFVLHYQPVVNLETAEIVGAEALVRWQHPERGLLAPDQFIAAAEESGLIVPLGDWVLRQAIEDARWWTPSDPRDPPLSIAVNVSAIQLRVPNLPFNVARLLSTSGVDPSRLHLEITESVLVRDLERSSEVLLALRALGVQVDVDDFGTGYSSLTYLQRLPVDALKIDKSFVDGLDGPGEDSSIVEAVVNLARSLGVAVVAEGVESGHQRQTLRRLGCELAQGYHFAKPVPLAAFTGLLRAGPTVEAELSGKGLIPQGDGVVAESVTT